MKTFLSRLLKFAIYVILPSAALLWYAKSLFLQDGGKLVPEFVEPANPGIPTALAFILAGLAAILITTGLAWTFLKAWKPFALAFAGSIAINGALGVLLGLKVIEPKYGFLYLATGPLSLGALVYGAFMSLKNNLLLLTLVRLIGATTLSVIITALFPFLVVAAGFYLKFKRGLKFSEVWSESPELYNFLIVNLYPIVFEIIPGFRYVLNQGNLEKRRLKKAPATAYNCNMDLTQLKVGDVILTGVDSWNIAVPIQASNILSNSETDRHWCHAAIYAGNGTLIEAQSDGRGVTETDIAAYFFPRGQMMRIFRHRYLSEADLDKAVQFCRDQKGCPYDTWGVSFYGLAALIPPLLSGWLEQPFAERFFNVDKAYFCSELVADGFKHAGHDIFKRRSWRVKPLDFAYTPVFDEITELCGYRRWEIDPAAGTRL
jgi:uncharacterized protein YycO